MVFYGKNTIIDYLFIDLLNKIQCLFVKCNQKGFYLHFHLNMKKINLKVN